MNPLPSSTQDAFATLERLAEGLSDPTARADALRELHALADRCAATADAPLRMQTIDLGVGVRREHLRVLLLPSIFAPESWAYTFLEGLLRVPPEELAGKSLVEVGTGSGWICVALAKLTDLSRIEGVDLNPHSAALATCNLWLNCTEEQAARVSFSQGDLLRDFPPEARWDFVVGCIPQVLRAEGFEVEGLEDADEATLYDLSNYCAMQNVYEDHFGLGLIAKLLDECPERLETGGRLLLNLAGRPGSAIIERMFTRRGFSTRVRVRRRVMQAADTDIRPLVTLEQSTDSEFEFYLAQHSPEPIRAETALGWLSQGNPIWHEVGVWEAWLRHPHETLALRRALREAGAEELLADVDLGRASQEQLAFVASLAGRLARSPEIPYAHEAGDPSFRRKIAAYLARYFGLHLGKDEIFVAPEREQAIFSLLLATCDPGDQVLVTRNVHSTYERACAKAGVRVTVTNDVLREVHSLLRAFDPKVIVLSVSPQERANLSSLLEIVDAAAERGIWVVIDESPHLNLTSGVEPLTLFELLAKEPHRPNLVVLYGLIKNAVFPDYELTLLLPVAERLFADLMVAAEVTYSRISTLVQWLYDDLLADLLSFQVSFTTPAPQPPRRQAPMPLPRSARIEAIGRAEAFAPPIFEADDPRLIRMDYGENEDRMPAPLVEGILAASLAPQQTPHALEETIAAFLAETRGVSYAASEIRTAQGVWPLIHDTAHALGRHLGRAPRIYVATPCYGVIPPTLLAAGAEVEIGPLEGLARLEQAPPDAILISQPSNPAGAYLGPEALSSLASFSLRHGSWILSDEIFGLVDLGDTEASTVPSPAALGPEVAAKTVIFGGLSKEFASGGLRVGWAALRDRELLRRLAEVRLASLQRATSLAASHLYGAWTHAPDGRLVHPRRRQLLDAYLEGMRRGLASKRALVARAFGAAAVGDEHPPGGLFLAPRVTQWLGKEIDGERITPETLPAILYRHTGVVVNGGPWCQDRERIRLVFSIPQEQVEAAAARIEAFAAKLG